MSGTIRNMPVRVNNRAAVDENPMVRMVESFRIDNQRMAATISALVDDIRRERKNRNARMRDGDARGVRRARNVARKTITITKTKTIYEIL